MDYELSRLQVNSPITLKSCLMPFKALETICLDYIHTRGYFRMISAYRTSSLWSMRTSWSFCEEYGNFSVENVRPPGLFRLMQFAHTYYGSFGSMANIF